MEVTFFQAYIDGVDFVFVDSPMFHHIEKSIYGGNRVVRYLSLGFSFCQFSRGATVIQKRTNVKKDLMKFK